MGVASPCQWGMGECWEPSGCSLETTPGPGTVKHPSWRPAGGQSCGAAAGSAHVMRWARESSGVLRPRSRLARYGPSGSPERSHRWKSAGFSVSSSLMAAGLGGGLRGVRTASRMRDLTTVPRDLTTVPHLAWTRCQASETEDPQSRHDGATARSAPKSTVNRGGQIQGDFVSFAEVFLERPRHSRRQGSSFRSTTSSAL